VAERDAVFAHLQSCQMTAVASATGELQTRLGHAFEDPALLERALTHTSAESGENYERLEFLGDRVLGLIVAELLLSAFPREREGEIGRRFAQLVRAEALARVGREIGVDAALTAAGGTINDGIIADATEAVIAALYLDGGFAAATNFVERHWTPLIDGADVPPRDAKTALQEWSQARGLGLPAYREIERAGPDHEPVFTVEVTVAQATPTRAQGGSKRAAEQAAAALILERLEGADGA